MDIMSILEGLWRILAFAWNIVWGFLSWIPGGQTVFVVLAIVLVYWLAPAFIRRLFRPGLGLLWSIVRPPLAFIATWILRLLLRLAGEEVLKNTQIRVERVEVPVSMPWRHRIRVRFVWWLWGYGMGMISVLVVMITQWQYVLPLFQSFL